MKHLFPISWPEGWRRTPDAERKHAPFKIASSQAKRELLQELDRLGARDIIISTDQPTNRDGSISAAKRHIEDTGVAIYFQRKGRDVVLACDKYWALHDNMRAIGKTIEAMRGIERWGASDMLDRAFTGFMALPAASSDAPPGNWRTLLDLPGQVTREQILAAFRQQAKSAHPDAGGSHSRMAALTRARDEALESLT